MRFLSVASRYVLVIAAMVAGCPRAIAQGPFEFGGYFEASGQLYSRTPNPSDTRAKGISQLRLWSRASVSRRVSCRGTYDFRIDTHRDVDRTDWLDVSDRDLHQPAGALREFYLDLRLNHVDLRMGKQEIRWGRADGYSPTDNINPYDYLDTLSEERIAVPALKADAYFGRSHLEGAWVPTFTPTRLPLLGQRWFPPLPATAWLPTAPDQPPAPVDLAYRDGASLFPPLTLGNGQWGLRWNQVLSRAEFSLSYFDGFDDVAFFRTAASDRQPAMREPPILLIALDREFYRVRIAGADFATELGPFGFRGEAAYFDQTDPNNQDHVLVTVGIDRSWGDWSAIVEYAELAVAGDYRYPATFPDLALRSTVMWRIERTLGPSQSFEVTGAAGLRDGGIFVQPLYSRTLTNRWRLKISATILAGSSDSYLGQFSRNDSLNLQLRWAF